MITDNKMKNIVSLAASTLCGDKVKNPQGEHIGEIKEIMIDTYNGKVSYAVLSFGGFMGLGEKLFAIPWQALSLDREKHEFVLSVAKETLAKAKGFDKNDWPDFADSKFNNEEIYNQYGYQPYWNL